MAAFKLQSHRSRQAASDYEKLVKSDPTNSEYIAGLVLAYSEFDLAAAEQYSGYIDVEDVSGASPIIGNADELESGVGILKRNTG